MSKAGISVAEFDPRDARDIKDQKHTTMATDDKVKLATEIHQRRILRTCLFMPQAHLGLSIIKYFGSSQYNGPHAIPDTMVQAYTQQRPAPKPSRPQRELTPEVAALAFGTKDTTPTTNKDNDNNNMELDSQQSNSNNSNSNNGINQ